MQRMTPFWWESESETAIGGLVYNNITKESDKQVWVQAYQLQISNIYWYQVNLPSRLNNPICPIRI